MPKVTRPGAPKKARWTTAQKAAAQKKPHRGQLPRAGRPGPTADAPARGGPTWSPRPDRVERGARPDRAAGRPAEGERRPRPASQPRRAGGRPDQVSASGRPRRGRPERERAEWASPERDRGQRERPAWNGREGGPVQRGRTDSARVWTDSDRRPARPSTEEGPRWADSRRPQRQQGAQRPARTEFTERPRRAEFTERPRRAEFTEGPRRDQSAQRSPRPERREGPPRGAWEARNDRRPARGGDRGEARGPGRGRERGERAAYRSSVVDPEQERLAADEWTSSARASVSDGPVAVAEDNAFAALGLPARLVERLARDGITEPFPIQVATIPDTLAGRDVLGRGQTGSGKTLAFGLPVLARLADPSTPRTPRHPRALVLVPTRELAMQVSDALEPLVHVLGLRHRLVAGGLSYTNQIAALQRGVDLLVATPGRLIDLIERGAVALAQVGVVVLDEADHMAEMGFLPEVSVILDQVPDGGQRLLFSATLDNGVDELVRRYLNDPITHSTDAATASVATMHHLPLLVDPQDKKPITAALATRPGRTLVFVRTKLGADRVAGQLREAGVVAAALHGGLSQGVRNRVLGAFRQGSVPVLVATDVAARGIHVDDVSLIVQVDPPADHKDYLHRAGRTARAGEDGSVVSLVLPHQRKPMERLLKEAGLQEIPTRVRVDDPIIAAVGGGAPSGQPLDEAEFARLLEPPHPRGPGGSRGPRPGARGGFRPHHGASGGRAAGGRGAGERGAGGRGGPGSAARGSARRMPH